jgi:hypothetical protein
MNLKEASDYLSSQISGKIVNTKDISKIVSSVVHILIANSNIESLKKQVFFLNEKQEKHKSIIKELESSKKILLDELRKKTTEDEMKRIFKLLDTTKKLRYFN